jgi:hypothetical protein
VVAPTQCNSPRAKRRLQHVAGIDRAFGLAGAHHRVQFVDKDDGLSRVGGDVLQYRLQPLLELAAVLGAGEQRRHVERQHALVFQRLGHLAIDDSLGEALDNRGLAHTRLADQHRIILGAPLQDLDRAPDLVVAADDRIELAFAGALGQVDRVFFQGLALSFRFLRIDAGPATHRFDRRFQCLAGEPLLFQQAAGLAFVVGEREQEKLAGDELVATPGGFLVGKVEQIVEVARDADLAALPFDFRQPRDRLRQRSLDAGYRDAGTSKQGLGAAVFLRQQRGQQVLGLDEAVVVGERLALRSRRAPAGISWSAYRIASMKPLFATRRCQRWGPQRPDSRSFLPSWSAVVRCERVIAEYLLTRHTPHPQHRSRHTPHNHTHIKREST